MVDKPYGNLIGVRPGKLVDQLLEYGLPPREIIHRLELERKVRRDRAELLTRVSLNQQDITAPLRGRGDLAALYIAVPFCPSRCSYCSFASHSLSQYSEREREAYFTGLLSEIEFLQQQALRLGIKFTSVYVGGGTPTTLSAPQLSRLSFAIGRLPWWEGKREVTLEGGRPDTITADKLAPFAPQARLCINPQTMHDQTLAAIGRSHSAAHVADSFAVARSLGFGDINADLIVGLPGEGSSHVAQSLGALLKLSPEGVTVHMFSPKRASAYSRDGGWVPMDAAEALQASNIAHAMLTAAGMEPYYLYRQRGILGGLENIGFALPGHHSLYNIQVINEQRLILGAGAGASSKFVTANEPWDHQANPKDARVYLRRLPELLQIKASLLDKWRNEQ